MKERIYTIPLTEALSVKSECLLCVIEEKITFNAIKFYTGPAMMEPDIREQTNYNGFCCHHYSMMHEIGSKLSSALVLQTRLGSVCSSLHNASSFKKTRFSKSSHIEEIRLMLEKTFEECTACNKIEGQMKNCYENFVFLLTTEPDFRKAYFDSKGLCMKHFITLLPFLTDGNLFEDIFILQQQNLTRLKSEVDKFVLKFDYRNTDMAWENAQDSRNAPLINFEENTIQLNRKEIIWVFYLIQEVKKKVQAFIKMRNQKEGFLDSLIYLEESFQS